MRNRYKVLFFSFLILLSINSYAAPFFDTLFLPKKYKPFRALPIINYTPETSFGFGFAGLYFLRNKDTAISNHTPTSNIQLTAIYTLNNQANIELWYQIFGKLDTWRWYGFLDYNSFPFYYWGIGGNTTAEDKERYLSNFVRFRSTFLTQIKGRSYVGWRLFSEYYKINAYEPGRKIEAEKKEAFVTTSGPIIIFDKRDDVFYARNGWYTEFVYHYTLPYLKSDFDYSFIQADLRYYKTIFKRITLAGNFYTQHIQGNIPFNQYARLSGAKRLRGYLEGRFRDKNVTFLQMEIKTQLAPRWALSSFAGFGWVYGVTSPLNWNTLKPMAGAGIRFKISKKESNMLRLDFAFGKDGSYGIYFIMDEAF